MSKQNHLKCFYSILYIQTGALCDGRNLKLSSYVQITKKREKDDFNDKATDVKNIIARTLFTKKRIARHASRL